MLQKGWRTRLFNRKGMMRVSRTDLIAGEVYAMRRANGDWYAFDHQGWLRVPLFHSVHDALIARLRNAGMLLFSPVALDSRLLDQMLPIKSERDVTLVMVNDPFVSLSRGSLLDRERLAMQLHSAGESLNIPRSGNGVQLPVVELTPQRHSVAAATCEDEEMEVLMEIPEVAA
jgi:hypothetical protein